MLEYEVEKRLKNVLESKGCWVLKFLPLTQGGLPDRVVLVPDGRVVFIETKRPNAETRALQKKIHEKFRDRNQDVRVINSYQQIDELLKDLFGEVAIEKTEKATEANTPKIPRPEIPIRKTKNADKPARPAIPKRKKK